MCPSHRMAARPSALLSTAPRTSQGSTLPLSSGSATTKRLSSQIGGTGSANTAAAAASTSSRPTTRLGSASRISHQSALDQCSIKTPLSRRGAPCSDVTTARSSPACSFAHVVSGLMLSTPVSSLSSSAVSYSLDASNSSPATCVRRCVTGSKRILSSRCRNAPDAWGGRSVALRREKATEASSTLPGSETTTISQSNGTSVRKSL